MSADTLFVKLQVTGDRVHQGWLYREQGTAQGCYSVATANKKREGIPPSRLHITYVMRNDKPLRKEANLLLIL